MQYLAVVVLGNTSGGPDYREGTGWSGIISADRPQDVPRKAIARHRKSACRAYPERIIGVEVYSIPDEELLIGV